MSYVFSPGLPRLGIMKRKGHSQRWSCQVEARRKTASNQVAFFGAVLERVREAAQQLGHVCMADRYKCSLREMFSDILRRVLC